MQKQSYAQQNLQWFIAQKNKKYSLNLNQQ